MIMDTDGRVYDDMIVDNVSDRAMTPLKRKRSRMWWDLAEDLGRKKPAPTTIFYRTFDGRLIEIPIEDKSEAWRKMPNWRFKCDGSILVEKSCDWPAVPQEVTALQQILNQQLRFLERYTWGKWDRLPWHKRGLAGRLGSTRLNRGLEALLMRAVNIIAHMLGFWRDREERRLLRVELLDRNRKGRKLWT